MEEDLSKSPRNPTPAELEILRALWKSPGSTVRELMESSTGKPQGYTTLLKMLQIMHEKGLVERQEDGKAHRYSAASGQSETRTGLVTDLINRAFEGAAQTLVMHALAAKRPSREELAEIRKMLEMYEERTEEEPK